MNYSIRELRDKLQAEKMPLRGHYWGYIWLYRKPSIYITYLLSYTSVTANQVSILVLLLGLSASTCAYFGNFYVALGLAYLNILFDGVDGEIARLRGIFSLRGVYVDALNHLIVPGLFLLSLSLRLNIIVGLFGALAWSLLKATGKLENKIFIGAYFGQEAKYNLPNNTPDPVSKLPGSYLATWQLSLPRRLFGLRYQFREFLIALIIFLIAEIIGLLYWTVFIYSIFLILHFFEEAYRGFFNIESRVQSLGEGFK